ncbi:MAG: hypothetical protein M1819_002839 [Sarea resinae]|nr:MAG: hypothetical protein M1819_002839 [Sarea resinae]
MTNQEKLSNQGDAKSTYETSGIQLASARCPSHSSPSSNLSMGHHVEQQKARPPAYVAGNSQGQTYKTFDYIDYQISQPNNSLDGANSEAEHESASGVGRRSDHQGLQCDLSNLAVAQGLPEEPILQVSTISDVDISGTSQSVTTCPDDLPKKWSPTVAEDGSESELTTEITHLDESEPQALSSLRKSKSSSIRSDAPIDVGIHPSTRKTSQDVSTTRLGPKASIPHSLLPEEYARQCIHAAYSSRLNPFALHPEELSLTQNHLDQFQTANYLNIRNGVLRLWTRNPLVSVTEEEAIGCAKDLRWSGVAKLAYVWLVRRGYINFGCVEAPRVEVPSRENNSRVSAAPRKTIVVIGAGVAGLGCARQLDGLFRQYSAIWKGSGEEVPRVVVLEGRGRIGGRVYSHPLRAKKKNASTLDGLQCTAEMGAQIITGFERGNPLNSIIRGQLALRYHPLRDNAILYDTDGSPVDKDRDILAERLYNDILERVSMYRYNETASTTAGGNKSLMMSVRDPPGEQDYVSRNTLQALASKTPTIQDGAMNKSAGNIHLNVGSASEYPAATAALLMGWQLKSGVLPTQSFDLDDSVQSRVHPTLGATMDYTICQYQKLIELKPLDMRLLNWHYANLEYANAINVSQLSLGSWDQDTGNEFEGEHAEVIGGYMQVPRGIWQSPNKLDVWFSQTVQGIKYNPHDRSNPGESSSVICDNGEIIEADRIVLTAPLGVLKKGSIKFEPQLPDWKLGATQRLGYGTLNKVVLVYEEPFWDKDRDMFGLLREPEDPDSLNQEDYVRQRGRFYLFWNCLKTSGVPMLVALMAGDAALQTETSDDESLVKEVSDELRKVFVSVLIPEPSEVIVTRWGNDPFACGSYSYVGSEARPDDYDQMARPIGNLHFAGEATCGTHPATVHGAYLSGLRAASEVLESLVGPIKVPFPLLPPINESESTPIVAGQKRRRGFSTSKRAHTLKQARSQGYKDSVLATIQSEIGERPSKPGKPGGNPFLLYQKDHWIICKTICDESRKVATGDPDAKASRNDVRSALGRMWKDASAEEKRPYLEQTARNRALNNAYAADYRNTIAKWDREAERIRRHYLEQNPNRCYNKIISSLPVIGLLNHGRVAYAPEMGCESVQACRPADLLSSRLQRQPGAYFYGIRIPGSTMKSAPATVSALSASASS